jgi:hypothetical protein
MSAKLYIVTIIDGDDGSGEYWLNAVDPRYARRDALKAHEIETRGAYCEVHSVQGPFDYDDEFPLASAGEFARRDHRGRNLDVRH